jgi:hypothetical protein
MDIKHISSCSQLTEEHFAFFSRTRELTYALIERAAEISAYQDGAEKIILFLARVALHNTWLDGGVRVDVRSTGAAFRCQLVFMCDRGGSFDILKKVELNTSYTDFLKVKDSLKIKPFSVKEETAGGERRLIFTASEAIREMSVPPPEFKAAQAKLAKLVIPGPPPMPRDMPQLRPDLQAALEAHRVRPPTTVTQTKIAVPQVPVQQPATPPPQFAPAAKAPPPSLRGASSRQTLAYVFGGLEPPALKLDKPGLSPGVQAAQERSVAAQRAPERAARPAVPPPPREPMPSEAPTLPKRPRPKAVAAPAPPAAPPPTLFDRLAAKQRDAIAPASESSPPSTEEIDGGWK